MNDRQSKPAQTPIELGKLLLKQNDLPIALDCHNVWLCFSKFFYYCISEVIWGYAEALSEGVSIKAARR